VGTEIQKTRIRIVGWEEFKRGTLNCHVGQSNWDGVGRSSLYMSSGAAAPNFHMQDIVKWSGLIGFSGPIYWNFMWTVLRTSLVALSFL